MNVVTYTRVSSKEQLREGFSIPAQRALLQRYAADQGLRIVAEFSDDETAKRSGRTDFTRMVAYLKKHEQTRTILVEKTDRLYRNLKDYLTLDELGVEIHFVKEGSTINPKSHSSARFLHGIKVLMARNYVENLSEEVKKGMHEKARQGGFPTVAPVGYTNTKDACGIILDPQQADAVRALFEAAATGKSLNDLVHLAATLSLRGRSKRPLARSKIAFLLRNPLYIGTFIWGGITYQGTYEPLIAKHLFTEVQAILDGKSRPRTQRHHFTYTGMLRCGTCDGLLTGDLKKGRYVYYACRGRSRCKTYYPERVFEETTIALLESLRTDEATSDWLLDELGDWYDTATRTDAALAVQQDHRVKELQHLLAKSYEEKLLGRVTEATWQEHATRWHEELDTIQESMRASVPEIEKSEFLRRAKTPLELAQTAAAQYVAQTPEERSRLLQTLCSNYTVRDGSVSVSMRSPFDVLLTANEKKDWLGDRESNPD